MIDTGWIRPSIWRMTAALLLAGASGTAFGQPTITVRGSLECVRLDRACFRRSDVPAISSASLGDPMAGIGRIYRRIAVDGIPYPASAHEIMVDAEIRRGGYFNLWDLVSNRGADQHGQAVLLEFRIDGGTSRECYLSLGFNDSCIVFVDREPVWGVSGQREHCLGQNIVPIPLTDGRALVSLLLWKKEPWTTIPADTLTQEWAVNLAVCPTRETAWKTYLSNNSHFLDTPIVKSLGDLRFETCLEGYRSVTIRNLKGDILLEGEVMDDSTLKVSGRGAPLPDAFVGTITVGGDLAEALIIEGESSIDAMAERTMAAGTRLVPDWPAWEFRCRHLLKPEYAKGRDRWWARKMALSLAMAGLQTKFDRTAAEFRAWKSSAIEFGSYRSAMGGTTQHYRALIGPLKDGHSRPLAIFLPGAPMPVRPFLESYGVADLSETELLARTADACGVDILWPGNVDIDYGGFHARRWTDEALRALQADHPATGYRSVFVIGTCAAGVAALGYAETYGGVDGIVCWSPIVSRNIYRWPVQDKDWLPMLPRATLAAEATDTDLSRLKDIPVFCLFDHKVPGHGDREGTKRLCWSLLRLGGNVVQRWIPNPDPVLEWGLRAAESELEWLNWIAWNAPKTGPRSPRRELLAPQSIKEALISGYTIDPPDLPEEQAWVNRWTAAVAQYRGTSVDLKRAGELCRVHVRSTPRDAVIAAFTESSPPGRGLRSDVSNWTDLLKDYSDIWIARLDDKTPNPTIEIRHCGSGKDPAIPGFDLFREGSCKSAAWGYRNGNWELLQVWL